MSKIIFEPIFPLVYLNFFFAILFLYYLVVFLKSRKGIIIYFYREMCKFFLFVLTLIIWLNPKHITYETIPANDINLIISDKSTSNMLGNREKNSIEIEKKLLNKLDESNIEHILFEINDDISLGDIFSNNLNQIDISRLSAIFIISDGEVNEAEIRKKYKLDIPIYVLLSHENEYDQNIELVKNDKYVIAGETAKLIIKINDNNVKNTEELREVTFFIDGKQVAKQKIPVNINYNIDLPIDIVGNWKISVKLEERENELTYINNIVSTEINSIKDKMRILLISGKPTMNTRSLRNFLKSDGFFELIHFVILRPVYKADTAKQNELSLIVFPQDELFLNKINSFDLVIFDRYVDNLTLRTQDIISINNYIENGGGALIIMGKEANFGNLFFNILRNHLYPDSYIEKEYIVSKTDMGKKHPITKDIILSTKNQKFLKWDSFINVKTNNEKTLLATDDDEKLLTLHNIKNGRLALMTTDNFWLWSKDNDLRKNYKSLIINIANWLIKNPNFDEEQIHAKIIDDEIYIERISVLETIDPFSIIDPNNNEITIEPDASLGKFSAKYKTTIAGEYIIKSNDLSTQVFYGGKNLEEYKNISKIDENFKSFIQSTKGDTYHYADNNSNIPFIRYVDDKLYHDDKTIKIKRKNHITYTNSKEKKMTDYPLFFIFMIILFFTWLLSEFLVLRTNSNVKK